jgi:hypothetical protein
MISELVPLIQTLIWVALLLAVLIFLRPEIILIRRVLTERVERGGAVKIGPLEIGELRDEIHHIEKRQGAIEERQGTLESRMVRMLITVLVTEFEVQKLKGLAAEGPFNVSFHWDMQNELKHLDAMRLVQPREGYGLVSIQDHSQSGEQFDLKRYVQITDRGIEYLKLLNELQGSS